jgi:SAM-dependent methyltransferase
MSVLDVGCGTGAITRGIAQAVGPRGTVVGLDRDPELIEWARAQWASISNLRFDEGDAARLGYEGRFEVVTAARTLQWIADPGAVLRRMTRAARPGGWLVVLDYNHALNEWEPAPPAEFATFYAAFLSWRASNGWDNEVANRCPALLEEAGLQDVRSEIQDETAVRGAADFDERTALWTGVIDGVGPALQRAQACDARRLDAARRSFEAWRTAGLARQTLSMRATVARVPVAVDTT